MSLQLGKGRVSSVCSPSIRTNITSYVSGHAFDTSGPHLIGKTVGNTVDDVTEKFHDDEFLVFLEDGCRLTFGQFRDEMDRLAAGLVSIGIGHGDRVGIWGPNSLEWVLTMFATTRIGATLVNLNPAYLTSDIEFAIKKVGLKTIVASKPFRMQNYYAMLADLCPELKDAVPGRLRSKRLPSLQSVITMGNEGHPGALTFDDVLSLGRQEHYDVIHRCKKTVQFDDAAHIVFTSAVCLPVPLFHVAGTFGLLTCLLRGDKTVFPSAAFNAKSTLRALDGECCGTLAAVPTMLIDILNQPETPSYDLSNLEILTGASHVPTELREKLIKRKARVHTLYGMTETGLTVTFTRDDDPEEAKLTSVGRPVPWVEVKVMDHASKEVLPVNTPGEICVRSPCNMTGYWGDEEKTKQSVDSARWMHTGDIGVMDEDGYLSVIDRIKDVVIRGGVNIYPANIERVVLTHPKVLNIQVQHYMVPRYIQFVDSYPLNPSGKVQKFKLREIMLERLNLTS
ncbi:medium-chain acyl-CoA ligase ACSF2, mitochondrial-like [Diadema antillarum]|uniref:medium-chain acyl-CoA ligase ACSF2, mitochondrial-like n=1 Tax=Diadema antillarum TaxID=105358 RepID=UPI003A8A8D59